MPGPGRHLAAKLLPGKLLPPGMAGHHRVGTPIAFKPVALEERDEKNAEKRWNGSPRRAGEGNGRSGSRARPPGRQPSRRRRGRQVPLP